MFDCIAGKIVVVVDSAAGSHCKKTKFVAAVSVVDHLSLTEDHIDSVAVAAGVAYNYLKIVEALNFPGNYFHIFDFDYFPGHTFGYCHLDNFVALSNLSRAAVVVNIDSTDFEPAVFLFGWNLHNYSFEDYFVVHIDWN